MIETVYFGTYTQKTSKGIYAADFDTETGQLDNLRLLAKEGSPTYLAFSSDGYLYSVSKQEGRGGIASFNPDFQLINQVLEERSGLCYVSVDDKRQLIYGVNYHKGQLLIYKRQNDGKLNLVNKLQCHGAGPHTNQDRSHLHFADLTPDKYLVTCDLGTDSLTSYDINADGKLTKIGNYQAAPGAGCRHLIFHPDFKIAYMICELNATIEVLIYDGYGQFEHCQTISTLPDDYHGFNACAAIRISSDGKFVYASNRGHNSIAVFEVTGDGILETRQIISTSGENPRDFNLSPDGKFLLAAHQDSDNVTIFKRDKASGILTEISHDFLVPEAVCLVFKK